MKAAILGGALALALWGGAAFANDGEGKVGLCPDGSTATDASGQACPEANEDSVSDDAMGGSGLEPQSDTAQTEETTIIAVDPADDEMKYDEDENDDRGVTVLLGGGVDAYTGDLAPQLNPGPSWGVGVALKPTGALGLELGYTGAINSVTGSSGLAEDPDSTSDINDEADIIRHGGSAVATIGLGSGAFQPYLLGGIGVDRYNARNSDGGTFRDDTVGQVPLGLGFRSHIGDFTADLRGTYGVLFNQGFAPNEGNTDLSEIGSETPTGRFGAQLRLGATF